MAAGSAKRRVDEKIGGARGGGGGRRVRARGVDGGRRQRRVAAVDGAEAARLSARRRVVVDVPYHGLYPVPRGGVLIVAIDIVAIQPMDGFGYDHSDGAFSHRTGCDFRNNPVVDEVAGGVPTARVRHLPPVPRYVKALLAQHLDHARVAAVAAKHDRTASQVLLRWALQSG